MTGEWIVYAEIADVNHYLTLATHRESDSLVKERVRSCFAEFPELALRAALSQTASIAARNRRPRSRVPALVDADGARAAAARKEAQDAQASLARAELLARLIGAVESGFFPVLVLELDLTFGQAEQLERAWFHFRRRVSRRVASA